MKDFLPVIIGIIVASAAFIYFWRQGAFLRVSGYFRATEEELRKCTWPTREELLGHTVVVLVSVALLGGFTVGVDYIVTILLRMLL
jgi:preprotein translocase subunit SecE